MSQGRILASRSGKRLARALGGVLVAAVCVLALARPAHAQTLGVRSQLVIDQLSGFRFSTDGNLNYYGPIGFSVRSVTDKSLGPPLPDETFHYTSFWLAPSADFFVIDHLSVGGLIEYSTTSVSFDATNPDGTVGNHALPTLNSFTIEPRAGWLFNLGDRFAIWPRLGLGYTIRQRNQDQTTPNGVATARITNQGFLLDVDVGFLWRFTDSWFAKVAPQVAFVPGGSHSQTNLAGASVSADASAFELAGVAGIGVYLDL